MSLKLVIAELYKEHHAFIIEVLHFMLDLHKVFSIIKYYKWLMTYFVYLIMLMKIRVISMKLFLCFI